MQFTKPHLSQPLVAQIVARQAELGVSEKQLCKILGYEREGSLTGILSGSLKMPIAKLPALAEFLGVDPVELMQSAIPELSPELFATLEVAFSPLRLTVPETNLIRHLRKLSGDRVGVPIVFEGKAVIALVAAQ